jgi:superfamily I DNA/RNA helicase
VSAYIDRTKKVGYENSTLICYSNRQCSELTKFLRPAFGLNMPTLSKGDLLLVTQNNLISGLLNGDLVEVEEIGRREKRAGLTFLYVSVKELQSRKVYSQYLIEEILYTNRTNLSQEQQKTLFIDYYYRMKEKFDARNSKSKQAGRPSNQEEEKKQKIQNTEEFKEGLQKDPYLNALRAVYGFALTCHKSQGGEWDYVYLDIPRYFPQEAKPYVYQWIYTAMTRAKKELYIVDDFWVV